MKNVFGCFCFSFIAFGFVVSPSFAQQVAGYSDANGGIVDDDAQMSLPIPAQAIPACMAKVGEINNTLLSGSPESKSRLQQKYCGNDLQWRAEYAATCNDLAKCGEELARCFGERSKWCDSIAKTTTPPPVKTNKRTSKVIKTIEVCNKDDLLTGRAAKTARGKCECTAGSLMVNHQQVTIPRIFVRLFSVTVGQVEERRGVCLEAMSGRALDIAVGAAVASLDEMLRDPRFKDVVKEIVSAQEELYRRGNPPAGDTPASIDFDAVLKPVVDRLAALEKRVDEVEGVVKEHTTHLGEVDRELVGHDQEIASLKLGQQQTQQDVNGLRLRDSELTGRIFDLERRSSATGNPASPPAENKASPPPPPPEKKEKKAKEKKVASDNPRFLWGVQISGLNHYSVGGAPQIWGVNLGFRPRVRIAGALYLYLEGAVALEFNDVDDVGPLPFLQAGTGLEVVGRHISLGVGANAFSLWYPGGYTVAGRRGNTLNWGGGGELRLAWRTARKVEIFGAFKPGYGSAWFPKDGVLQNKTGFGFTTEFGIAFIL